MICIDNCLIVCLSLEWKHIDSEQQYTILKMMQEIMSIVLTERPVIQAKVVNSIIHIDYLTNVRQSLKLLEEFSISMAPRESVTNESRLQIFERNMEQVFSVNYE
jgi:hypothetical protein